MSGTITRELLSASIYDALVAAFGPAPSAAAASWQGASDAIANGVINGITANVDDGDALFRDGDELVGDTSGGGGVTDHGALTGLADNDHPQYLLAAAAVTEHGALTGLSDDDHTQYLLRSEVSTFGASLIDDVDAVTARATLGLGSASTHAATDFEASGSIATHAALASGVHGISTFAATLLDDTSSGAFMTTLGISAFVQTVLDDANAAAVMSTLGITSFVQTLLDDTTAAVFRATLGSTTVGDAVFVAANAGAARTALGLATVASSGSHADLSSLTTGDPHTQYLLRTDVATSATRFIARVAPPITVASTTSATSILGGVISIPANTLTVNGQSIRGTFHGTNHNQTGNTRGWNFLMSLNAVTLVQDAGFTFTSQTFRRIWLIDVIITRVDATHCTAVLREYHNTNGTAPDVGVGQMDQSGSVQALHTANGGIAGIDWTAAQNFDLTVAPTENSANLDWVTDGGNLEAA